MRAIWLWALAAIACIVAAEVELPCNASGYCSVGLVKDYSGDIASKTPHAGRRASGHCFACMQC